MTARRTQSLPPNMVSEKQSRGRCIAAICVSWKVITCVVSHVTLVLLVVSYCVGGAFMFKHLEKPHELEIKKGIQNMRRNLTDKIWKFSDNASVLSETDWIGSVTADLANFENQILTAMKKEGWDGDEDITKSQWTFAGSLFYSIIVITTIGYGHISPHTDWGKVTTIFYAIVGIPLMLLCLSNIGDVMATSFRFLYWRVCCFVCTRTSRRARNRSRQRPTRSQRYVSRSQPPPFRRSMKATQRSVADSGVGASVGLPHAYSDPELCTAGRSDFGREYDYARGGPRVINTNNRDQQNMALPPSRRDRYAPASNVDYYNEENLMHNHNLNRGSRYKNRQKNQRQMRERHTVERERHLSRSKQKFDSMEELNRIPQHAKRTLSVRSVRSPQMRRNDEAVRETKESFQPRELNVVQSQFLHRGRSMPNTPKVREKTDPRGFPPNYQDVDEKMARKTPIISNRYAINELEIRQNHLKNSLRSQSMPRSALHKHNYRSSADPPNGIGQRRQSFNQPFSGLTSRYGNRLELPEFTSPHTKRERSPRYEEYEDNFEECFFDEHEAEEFYNNPSLQQSRVKDKRREKSERLPPSPRIMSPMGFAVKRQVRRRPSYDYDEDSVYGDEMSDYYGDISPKDRPVPIWLCVFLVISYILGGAALFANWEKWSFLDSAYFCFITLTTIGFGDFVPAKGVQDESEQSIAYCSLYLLFGIALLAMSFNLVQEEFIANVKEVARRLGILKDEEEEE